MAILYVQSPTLYLSGSGVIVGATSVGVTALTDIYANVLTMADFGALGYFTCEPDTSNAEGGTFTGITANANGTYTLTGVKTILAKSPYTQTSGLVRNHAGGTKIVITDNVGFWATFLNKENNETIVGRFTYPNGANRPILDSDTDTATAAALVSFGQLSRQAISGAANGSTTVKGIFQAATQAQDDARTTAGSTGALLILTPDTQRSTLLSDYKADTGAANAYVITPVPAITAYTAGQIFTFKATNANTTVSTVNVSALGVKTIKKLGGATDLASGDIAAGMMVEIEYDGTNFVMLNPVANAPLTPTGSGLELTNTTRITRLAGYSPAANTTENTVFTTSITGNLLSTNGIIKVRTPINWSTNATADTYTIRGKFGGSTLHTHTLALNAVGGGTNGTGQGVIEFWIINNAATNSQNHSMGMAGGSNVNATTNLAPNVYTVSADGTSAIDTTSAQTLTMTVQRSIGTGGSVTFNQTLVETIKNA